jgi:hypothetical protein
MADDTDRSGEDDACHAWTGTKDRHGYGVLRVGTRQLKAHRIAYELAHGAGSLDPGAPLLHKCPGGGTRACLNPRHLNPGTVREDIADAMLWGTLATGDRNGARLTAPLLTKVDALAIRSLRAEGLSYGELAHPVGVVGQRV